MFARVTSLSCQESNKQMDDDLELEQELQRDTEIVIDGPRDDQRGGGGGGGKDMVRLCDVVALHRSYL